SYSSTPPDAGGLSTRSVWSGGSSVPRTTDTYGVDGSGRIWKTPAISSIWNTDDDKIGSVTERATGQLDSLIYDGLGNRVLTLYGANGSAGPLLTLDDVFELKRSGSGAVIEGRCRLRADARLIGDLVRGPTGARTATFYLEDAVGSI